MRYLDDGFAELFVRALGGLSPHGRADDRFRGRHLGRNAAMGELVLSSGLRRREFTYLLVYEVPALPALAVARRWAVFHSALEYAVELGHLASNPLRRFQWQAPKVAEAVDRRGSSTTTRPARC